MTVARERRGGDEKDRLCLEKLREARVDRGVGPAHCQIVGPVRQPGCKVAGWGDGRSARGSDGRRCRGDRAGWRLSGRRSCRAQRDLEHSEATGRVGRARPVLVGGGGSRSCRHRHGVPARLPRRHRADAAGGTRLRWRRRSRARAIASRAWSARPARLRCSPAPGRRGCARPPCPRMRSVCMSSAGWCSRKACRAGFVGLIPPSGS